MEGQACVLYGAAEFSRDADFAILVDPENLGRLKRALADLQAECIAVPPFEADYLRRGHAIHFRCQHAEARGMRIDLMAKMRGVDPFDALWERRSTLELPDGLRVDVMALPDLVSAKKTQRDKDWPMIRRFLEVHYSWKSCPDCGVSGASGVSFGEPPFRVTIRGNSEISATCATCATIARA